ncbi:MAG: putative sulfate/molybdate transporter [Candidatus Heimdallarchaeota archaeon]
MKFRGFDFSLREFSGALGDFGTLMPFSIGYIVVCGFNPTGLLLGIGLTNICLAFFYRLPLPVQPKKAIGTIAIANHWPASRVWGAGFGVGVIWLGLAAVKGGHMLSKVPKCVIRGIQLGLAVLLGLTGAEMLKTDLYLAIPLLTLALLLLRNRILPAALFLLGLGGLIAWLTGTLQLSTLKVTLALPSLYTFSLGDLLYGLAYAGIAQLFLTLTNAVVATVALVHDLFPDRRDVTPQNLILNMGLMNVTTPLIGGMPLCHGAGGLAAQYLFGARTGGALFMEGAVEIFLGLFCAQSILAIFTAFPPVVIGVMLFLAATELGRVALDLERKEEVFIMALTALLSATFNIAVGFVAGLLVYFGVKRNLIRL